MVYLGRSAEDDAMTAMKSFLNYNQEGKIPRLVQLPEEASIREIDDY